MFNGLCEMLTTNESMYIVLGVVIVGCLILFWRIQQDLTNSASVLDLITTGGKLSERKVSRFGAWIVSTWGFVFMIMNDRLTEWYFVGYMGVWVANALISKQIGPIVPPTKSPAK